MEKLDARIVLVIFDYISTQKCGEKGGIAVESVEVNHPFYAWDFPDVAVLPNLPLDRRANRGICERANPQRKVVEISPYIFRISSFVGIYNKGYFFRLERVDKDSQVVYYGIRGKWCGIQPIFHVHSYRKLKLPVVNS